MPRSVDTVGMTFNVNFVLGLGWTDIRLNMQNLNNDPSQNRLGHDKLMALWVPQLSFSNALGSLQTVVDEMTTAVIVRKQEKPNNDRFTSPFEG